MPAATTLLTAPGGLRFASCRAWGVARRSGCAPSGSEPWSGSTRSGSCWRQVALLYACNRVGTAPFYVQSVCLRLHATARACGLSGPLLGWEPGLLKVACPAAPYPLLALLLPTRVLPCCSQPL